MEYPQTINLRYLLTSLVTYICLSSFDFRAYFLLLKLLSALSLLYGLEPDYSYCILFLFLMRTHISNESREKLNNYAPLQRNMQLPYPNYRFEMLPILVGAHGYVPSCLFNYMNDLGFEKKKTFRHISKMQAIVTSRTVKICNTSLNF